MKKLSLTLANDLENLQVEFDIFDTSIANRWADEVAKNYPLFEVDRFKGWPNSKKTVNYYKTEILRQIKIVNEYVPGSISLENDIFNQEILNYLHKFFEDLRGELNTGTDFYNSAPAHVKNAVVRFNILIHELEHLMRNPEYPTIVCTFNQRPRLDLLDEDYDHFTFKWKFGHVYINYCEVGKPLLDVFKDQDKFVGIDNIRPLRYYSADFMIKFGPDTPDDVYEKRLAMFYEWYKQQPFKFEKLSLGLIPVAKISNPDIVEKICEFDKIKTVCIK